MTRREDVPVGTIVYYYGMVLSAGGTKGIVVEPPPGWHKEITTYVKWDREEGQTYPRDGDCDPAALQLKPFLKNPEQIKKAT